MDKYFNKLQISLCFLALHTKLSLLGKVNIRMTFTNLFIRHAGVFHNIIWDLLKAFPSFYKQSVLSSTEKCEKVFTRPTFLYILVL